ncbi:hypothetical protein ACFOYU_06840 [Microvirga sp. GCM10011540]|uniref:hypothetical protein n=1 Tax=Microvirga sp. GCM10011540 TaxID=3317338 RepID=UPI00360F144C
MNDTRPQSRFRSLYRQSLPGSRINEDEAGLHGSYAWIIDGATGLSGGRLTAGATDAAWLARTIGQKLGGVASSADVGEVFDWLETGVRDAFAEEAVQTADSEGHGPSACLGLLRVCARANGKILLEGGFLGDVVALVSSANGVVRWTDERAKPFERRTLAALAPGGHEPGQIPEAVRRQILENREQLNRPEGYWVVHPTRPWAGRELRFETEAAPDEPIVLATDGFMRLVDVFGAYSDASLHARLAAGEGEDLMQELRELERSDPKAGVYPRVKIHDDATVLVIAAEPYG